jgi:hypothetical protein
LLRLEQEIETSIFIDCVVSLAHVFTSELPAHFVAPAKGCYRFSVSIDNVFLQPRAFDLPYAKCKLRIKAYLRAPGDDRWHLLSGIVRIQLPGEEWAPEIDYPSYAPGPILKPLLPWNVEKTPDTSAGQGQTPLERAHSDQQEDLAASQSDRTAS